MLFLVLLYNLVVLNKKGANKPQHVAHKNGHTDFRNQKL